MTSTGRDKEPLKHKAISGSNKIRRWPFLFAVAVLFFLLIAYAGVIALRIDRTSAALPGSPAGGTTYLLLGSDERTNIPTADRDRFGTAAEIPGRRADIILVLRVLDDGSTKALAVPRDLVVFRKDKGPERLAPMLQEGTGAIADGLCNSIGIGVDHVVIIDFSGLAGLVDLAGGVEVTSDVPLRDDGSGLFIPEGTTRLSGREALSYVRARHIESEFVGQWGPDPIRSSMRSQRAAEVLDGLSKGLALKWTDPIATHKLLWAVSDAVEVDGGTWPANALQLRASLENFDRKSLIQIPVKASDGPVPTAELAPGAENILQSFNSSGSTSDAGSNKACKNPVLLGG